MRRYNIKNLYIKVLLIVSLVAFCLLAQLPSAGLPSVGGSTYGSVQNIVLHDIKIDSKNTGIKGEKKIRIDFILSQKPTNYFHYFLNKPKRIVFDFYDTKPGDTPIHVLTERPFVSCRVEKLKVDMNKEVKGLAPDIRDLTRVTFLSKYEIIYNVVSNHGKITMFYHWTNDKLKQEQYIVKRKSNWWLWTFASFTAVGGGTAGYLLMQKGGNADKPLSSSLPQRPDL